MSSLELQTYRFSFDKEFVDELFMFSKLHQFDDRKTFKEEWESWIMEPDIEALINLEIKRLNHNGYMGDIIDKMFKSARYYYRKKSIVPAEQPDRKDYVGFSKDILAEMDMNIKKQIAGHHSIKSTQNKIIKISPSMAFDNYYASHKLTIVGELKQEEKVTKEDVNKITSRFKKAYKNRFYKIRVMLNKVA